jgi:hypothetical protein
MTDKIFLDLLKAKVAEMKPSEKYRNNDWLSLQDSLQITLPQPPRVRRRAIALPILLLTALLSSNAVWWQVSRNDRTTMTQLSTQIANLQDSISKKISTPYVIIRIDTIWQTVYLQQMASIPKKFAGELSGINFEQFPPLPHPPLLSTENSMVLADEPSVPGTALANKTASTAEHPDSIQQLFDLTNLQLPRLALLHFYEPAISAPDSIVIGPLEAQKTTVPFDQSLVRSIRPKFFKVITSAGWLSVNSSGLMHEGGFACNLTGVMGLSRHWSLTSGFSTGKVHYKSHSKESILGNPVLPVLPSTDDHFAEMDVTGQKIHQLNLGLRYTFAQQGKLRTFFGIGWGCQMLLPFTIEYEIQHEPTGSIEKAIFEVKTRTSMRNILGLSGGFEIPISTRIDLIMEGFYQRQWKKPGKQAPDLTGIRAGLSWLF